MIHPTAVIPPSITDIKSRVSKLTPDELKTLNDIYQVEWRKNWLRTNGWVNLFCGGLTLLLGVSHCTCNFSFPALIQTLLGLLIVIQSLWLIASPSTPNILRFAILLLVVGSWNMLLALLDSFVGGAFLVGLLGAAQLWWAYQTYPRYQYYRQMELSEPPPDIAQLYEELWLALTRSPLKSESGGIQLWINRAIWQGLLVEDKVIFAFRNRKLLVIQGKDDVNFMPQSSKPIGKRRVYGKIKLNAIFERAMMKRDSFEKYIEWRGEAVVLSHIAPSLWQRLPKIIRIVLMILGGLALLYFVFMIYAVIDMFIRYG